MIVSVSVVKALPRLSAALALCVLGASLSGCADMSDGMTQAFADPAQYELYDCKQLESERKSLANSSGSRAELAEVKARDGAIKPVPEVPTERETSLQQRTRLVEVAPLIVEMAESDRRDCDAVAVSEALGDRDGRAPVTDALLEVAELGEPSR